MSDQEYVQVPLRKKYTFRSAPGKRKAPQTTGRRHEFKLDPLSISARSGKLPRGKKR